MFASSMFDINIFRRLIIEFWQLEALSLARFDAAIWTR